MSKNFSSYGQQDIYEANRPKFQWSFLKPRYWKIWLLLLLCVLISLLPYSVLYWFGTKLGKFFATSNLKVVRYRRQIARINIDLAFASYDQDKRDQIFNEFCINVGHGLFDVVIAWFYSKRRFAKLIKLPARDFSAWYGKKHFLFLCPHFMNLESNARAIGLVLPSYGVYLRNSNPLWDWVQYYFRLRNNKALVAKDNFRAMKATLALKEGLFYAPDQDLGRKSSIFVPFFDQAETCTTRGTYMLYRLFPDLTLVPCMLVKSQDPQYKFEFKILDAIDFPDKISDEEVVNITNSIIEQMILKDISNYMWFHRRFKNRKDFSNVYQDIT